MSPAIKLALVACIVVAALGETCNCKPVDVDNIDKDDLFSLVDLVRHRKAPSYELVMSAYKEYVELYKLQSRLAGSLGLEADQNALNEVAGGASYEKVNKILALPEVAIISSNIFDVISDRNLGPDGRVRSSRSLRSKIEKAIEALQLE